MLVPAGEHSVAVVMCPENHPLGRSLRSGGAVAETQSQHDAGHIVSDHDNAHHHGEAHEQSHHEGTSAECPFGLAGQLAAHLSNHPSSGDFLDRVGRPRPIPGDTPIGVQVPARLRPPARAPPVIT